MYIYAINFIKKESIENNVVIPDNVVIPNNYFKFFVAEETPKQVKAEHIMLYQNYNLEMYYTCNDVLTNNFQSIKSLFTQHPKTPLFYYFLSIGNFIDNFKNILTNFESILKCTSIVEKDNEINISNKRLTIYSSLSAIIKVIDSKIDMLSRMKVYNDQYNPCCSDFVEYAKGRDFGLIKVIHEREQNVLDIFTRMTNVNNPEWKEDIQKIKIIIAEEGERKFTLSPFYISSSQSYDIQPLSVLSFDENELQLYSEEDTLSDVVILYNNTFSHRKDFEHTPIKIKILEKGYFSEFNILNEYIIPKDNIILDSLKNLSIDVTEELFIKFNQMMENKKLCIKDQKDIVNIKMVRVLRDYLYHNTVDTGSISSTILFNSFMSFLTLYYPGFNNYFHSKNFATLIRNLGYKTVRRNDGNHILNISISNRVE